MTSNQYFQFIPPFLLTIKFSKNSIFANVETTYQIPEKIKMIMFNFRLNAAKNNIYFIIENKLKYFF